LRTRRLGLHLLRNGVHFCGQYLWVFSIGALPLATVFAIEFTMPVWTVLLGSLAYAASLILTKRLTTSDAPLAVLFWMSVIQLPMGLVASLPQWVTPVV